MHMHCKYVLKIGIQQISDHTCRCHCMGVLPKIIDKVMKIMAKNVPKTVSIDHFHPILIGISYVQQQQV